MTVHDTARRLAIAAIAVAAISALAPAASARAARHPRHFASAELRYDDRARAVRVIVRLDADDLDRALRRRGAASSADTPAGAAAVLAYLGDTFLLSRPDGRALPLRLEGIRRTGDLVRVAVSAASNDGPGGLTLRNEVLMDLFPDQVNVVRVAEGGTTRSLLFTRSARTRAL